MPFIIMAGYVVMKMMMKCKQRSEQSDIQKRHLFLCVLLKMESKATYMSYPSTYSTCEWVEMIKGNSNTVDDDSMLLFCQELERQDCSGTVQEAWHAEVTETEGV